MKNPGHRFFAARYREGNEMEPLSEFNTGISGMEKHWHRWAGSMPVPVFICNREGKVILINQPLAELVGYPFSPEGAVENALQAVPSERNDPSPFSEPWLDALNASCAAASPGIAPLEFNIVCRDGSTRYIECRQAVFQDKRLFIVNDLTEIKQIQEELSKSNERLKNWIYGLEVHNKKLNLLRQMGSRLQTSRDAKEAYGAIKEFGPRLFPETTAILYDLEETKNMLRGLLRWGAPAKGECGVLSVDACEAFKEDHLAAGGFYHPRRPCQGCRPSGSQNHLCIPLITAGKAQGLLHIAFLEANEVDVATTEFALIFSEQLSLSLANMKLHEALRTQATVDPLTGLFNRRYMEESLEREFHRSNRQKRPVSILMLDIDHFKRVNDTFGHDAGDALLMSLGSLIRRNFRKEDIACRFGGEEFLLILPDTPLTLAAERAESFRRSIANSSLNPPHSIGSITVSLGVASFPQNGQDAESLIRAADEALYRAKRNGRNRVETALPA